MTKEALQTRLAELQQAVVNMQANLHAAQGQIIEVKVWLERFEREELARAALQARDSLQLLAKSDESGA